MAYPFPHINIKVYPKTFLKDVHIGLFFPEAILSEELQERATKFFEKKFGLPNIKMEEMPNATSVFSNDNKIRFSFGLSRVDLSIKREVYRSFADTSPLLQILFDYLKVTNSELIEKIVFSKYNELVYEAKEDTPVAEVMEGVFSGDLLESMSQRDRETQKDLSRWEKIVRATGDDATDSIFTIEYGFSKKQEGASDNSLTLKTLIESRIPQILSTDIPEVLKEYNQVLDNAFHWCVSDQVLNAMKQ
jgi:hypothetical protein